MNQHEKALEHLQRAIELNQVSTVPSEKAAIQFNNLGIVYYKQKNFDQAKESYERALKLRLEYLPPTHPDIAQQGRYKEALPNATKALTENHPQTQEFMTSLQSRRQQLKKLTSCSSILN